VGLSRDSDAEVRDWATTALAALDADTPVLRAALAERLDDADRDTVAEAAQGLARRQDPWALTALERLLQEDAAGGGSAGLRWYAIRASVTRPWG
jgi:hypothetical protein